jgi:catechol 2,3-dioxygenase-like lactoylglutathione lyase family enzyme
MNIERIDHVVLTVRDIRVTCDFYARALGMEVVTFGGGRTALQFGQQKINLHEAGKEFEPKALRPTPGAGDLCFITRAPLDQVMTHLRSCGVAVVEGPVRRTGALGPMESVYIRDPDGNLVEIANYPSG